MNSCNFAPPNFLTAGQLACLLQDLIDWPTLTHLKPVVLLNSSSGECEPEQMQVQLSSSALSGPIHLVMLPTAQKIDT